MPVQCGGTNFSLPKHETHGLSPATPALRQTDEHPSMLRLLLASDGVSINWHVCLKRGISPFALPPR